MNMLFLEPCHFMGTSPLYPPTVHLYNTMLGKARHAERFFASLTDNREIIIHPTTMTALRSIAFHSILSIGLVVVRTVPVVAREKKKIAIWYP